MKPGSGAAALDAARTKPLAAVVDVPIPADLRSRLGLTTGETHPLDEVEGFLRRFVAYRASTPASLMFCGSCMRI
jgi:hypothetical protein